MTIRKIDIRWLHFSPEKFMPSADLRLINLPGISITTTPLGFGCSHLLSDKTFHQAHQILQTAYDAGIRHFDVARYYGNGYAESVLGDFARSRRDQITITTKFGMEPARRIRGLGGAMRWARRLLKDQAIVRRLIKRRVQAATQKSGRFQVEAARQSLETSLRELKTDFIDIYLLHECDVSDCQPSLLDFIESTRKAGKIRAFGIGTDIEKTRLICNHAPEFARVAQFHSSIIHPNIKKLPAIGATLTTGSFWPAGPLRKRMESDAVFARRCRDSLGVDCLDPNQMAALILQQAMRANPHGIVLFRSSRPQNIQANVNGATLRAFSDEQLDNFEALGTQLSGSVD